MRRLHERATTQVEEGHLTHEVRFVYYRFMLGAGVDPTTLIEQQRPVHRARLGQTQGDAYTNKDIADEVKRTAKKMGQLQPDGCRSLCGKGLCPFGNAATDDVYKATRARCNQDRSTLLYAAGVQPPDPGLHPGGPLRAAHLLRVKLKERNEAPVPIAMEVD
jgi:hypothetical protein